MSTPTSFHVPSISPTALCHELSAEARRQRDETPEPKFCQAVIETDYKYLCELQERLFSGKEIDGLRKSISDIVCW